MTKILQRMVLHALTRVILCSIIHIIVLDNDMMYSMTVRERGLPMITYQEKTYDSKIRTVYHEQKGIYSFRGWKEIRRSGCICCF